MSLSFHKAEDETLDEYLENVLLSCRDGRLQIGSAKADIVAAIRQSRRRGGLLRLMTKRSSEPVWVDEL